MLIAEARIRTDKASQYLARLCGHAGKMGRSHGHRSRRHADGGQPPKIREASWSGNDGTLVLNWGQCVLHASQDTLDRAGQCGAMRRTSPGSRNCWPRAWKGSVAGNS